MSAHWIESADRRTQCQRCPAVIETGQRFYYLRKGTYLCELCGSLAEHEEPVAGEVEAGVREDLAVLPPEAAERTLAKMMIAMARRIDNGDVADRDVSAVTKEIRQMLTQLQLNFPPKPEEDDTEKSRRRREQMLRMGDYEPDLRAPHADEPAEAGRRRDLELPDDVSLGLPPQPPDPGEAGRGRGPRTCGEVSLPGSG